MEPIPSDVAHDSLEAAWKCDLMFICGTSAVVYPFAQLPRIAREKELTARDAPVRDFLPQSVSPP